MKTTTEYAHEIIDRAIEYVAAGWCQAAAARDRHGLALTSPRDAAACTWCLTGALSRATHEVCHAQDPIDWDGMDEAYDAVLSAVRRNTFPAASGRPDLIAEDWNDEPGRMQADVIEMLRSVRRSAF